MEEHDEDCDCIVCEAHMQSDINSNLTRSALAMTMKTGEYLEMSCGVTLAFNSKAKIAVIAPRKIKIYRINRYI